MNSIRSLIWLGVPALALLGGALWLAYDRGLFRGGPDATEDDRHGSMPMADMSDGKRGRAATSKALAGYVELEIAPNVQQNIGVTFAQVQRQELTMAVRTVGIVRPNETTLAHVHLKTEGWVEKLFVAYTGQNIHKGDPLLAIYSPQFFAAQQDYIKSRQFAASVPREQPDSGAIVEASRARLELWDVPEEEIRQLETTRKPHRALLLRSPVSGTVLERKAFEGQYVKPDDRLYTVADLGTVWVQAKVYEYELPHISIGQEASVTLPSLPNRQFTGKVVFIDPVVEEETRTVRVRVELPNPDGLFRPGMFAKITVAHDMGEGLLVPTSAVIRTGEQDIAFLVTPGNLFVPVQVRIGSVTFGDRFQVLEGLQEGDRVVASANFLIDSESRLRAGGGNMGGMAGMEMGPPAKKDGDKSAKDHEHGGDRHEHYDHAKEGADRSSPK